MKKPLGLVLYRGKSRIDGKLIIVIATGFTKSENRKTGNMLQTWILRADIPPILAVQLGHDYSVCGNCKLKHFRSCYVNVAHGPHNTFYAYQRGRYTMFEDKHLELFKGRSIRLGSYGDPAAVPTEVWAKICSVTNGHTGYTHQWNARFIDPELKKYCMASCDNTAEASKAKELGWHYFRIRMSDNFNVPHDRICYNEFVCPASIEAKHKTDCSKCKACMGLGAKTWKDPVIIVHGLEHKIASFKWGMQRIAWKERFRRVFIYPPKNKKKRRNRQILQSIEKLNLQK